MSDYGDQAELDYIIEQGQLEAEQFGCYGGPFWKGQATPARWLNPPRPVPHLDTDTMLRKIPDTYFFRLFHYWPEEAPPMTDEEWGPFAEVLGFDEGS